MIIYMNYYSRLSMDFTEHSKYVLFSDCHRGNGGSGDNFLKNKPIYMAALQYYYRNGYSYIEVGDGDELWENRSMSHIFEIHNDVFCTLELFHRQNRLHMLYGNHDMVKKYGTIRFFSQLKFYPSIILENCSSKPLINHQQNRFGTSLTAKPPSDIYITHGHQTDLFNSTFWKLSRFLVRYLWRPLEQLGVLDPTSASKNYKRKKQTEKRLYNWAKNENHILITGHTHRPSLDNESRLYHNCGSCIHPYSITCIELTQQNIRLVKWSITNKSDMTLAVKKEILNTLTH